MVALRPGDADGGALADYRGAAPRRTRGVGAALVLALVGLAGLPPGLAGLFAKVAVVRSLLDGGAGWLAVVVALNAVIGLAYYVRVAAALYARRRRPWPTPARVPWAVAAALRRWPRVGRSWLVAVRSRSCVLDLSLTCG